MSKKVFASLSTRKGMFQPTQFTFHLTIVDTEKWEDGLVYDLFICKNEWSELERALSDSDVELCSALVEHFGATIKIRLLGGTIFDEYTNQYFSNLMDLLDSSGVLAENGF